jgi:class 3 adenylate cyclase
MHDTHLRSYIPDLVCDMLARQRWDDTTGISEQMLAFVMFADVAGFTAMAEALGAYGQRGTEELTLSLNRYFSTITGSIRKHGGTMARFAGDAMTIVLPTSHHHLTPTIAARGVISHGSAAVYPTLGH